MQAKSQKKSNVFILMAGFLCVLAAIQFIQWWSGQGKPKPDSFTLVDERPVAELLDVSQYGIQGEDNVYAALQAAAGEPVSVTDTSEIYAPEALAGFTIPDLARVSEFLKVSGQYTVTYTTTGGAFIVVNYPEDGGYTLTCNLDGQPGGEIIAYTAGDETARIYQKEQA